MVYAFKEKRISIVYQKSYTSDLRLGISYHVTLICALNLFAVIFLGSIYI